MRRPRFWVSLTCSFVLLGPLFGALGFLVGWGAGMRSFGPPSRAGGISAVIELLASLPLPVDAPPAWVFNGVCWGGVFALLVALAIARFPERRKREPRGFPIASESSPLRGHDWEKEKRSEDEEPEEKVLQTAGPRVRNLRVMVRPLAPSPRIRVHNS